ncbi:MAG TPA: PAS domain S-box protein [Anditalea sp.]|nr:PAS domain S-box protein [Anditalea sp.]
MIKKNRLWEIFSATITPSILIDGNIAPFRILAANNSFEKLYGTSEHNLEGTLVRNVFSSFAPESNKNFISELEDAIALVMLKKRPHDMMVHKVYLPIQKSTSLREKKWRIIITPFLEDQNQIDCILLSITDVTEQIQLQVKDKAIFYSLAYHQQLYKSIFENHPNQLFQLDVSGNFIAVNSKFSHFFGLDNKNLETIPFASLATIENEPIVIGFIQKCLQRTTQDFNTSLIAKSGKRIYCGITLIPLIVENKIVGIFGILIDKTVEKSNEQKAIQKGFYSTTLAEVNKILIEEPEEETTLKKVFNLTGNAIDVDRIYFYETVNTTEKNGKFLVQKLHWDKSILPTHQSIPSLENLPVEEFRPILQVLNKQRIYKAKISSLPKGKFKELLLEQQVYSIILIPVFWDKKFAGFISFQDCEEERNWTYEDILFLQSLVENLTIALEQRRSTKNFLEMQKKYETIIKNIPGIVYHCLPDQQRTMFFINDSVATITGYEANSFISKEINFPDIIHPDDINTVTDSLFTTLSNKNAEFWVAQYRVRRADGAVESVVDRASILRDETGNALRLIGVVLNISSGII